MRGEVEEGFGRVLGAQPAIPHGAIVSVETDIIKGLWAFSIVGLPDKAVEEARDRISAAIRNSNFTSPKQKNKKTVISLAPAALKKEGAVFDVPMALSYLLAIQEITFDSKDKVFAGELALDGKVRPIRGVLSIALAARKAGIRELYVPRRNAAEAALVSGITIFAIETLSDLANHLDADTEGHIEGHTPTAPKNGRSSAQTEGARLEDIRGQAAAKRGLEIAAAGRHNIAFYGPPGTGKTLLARALAYLLPPLSQEEIIEVTAIHSYAGVLEHEMVTNAPFRAPHHTSSYASLVGGGVIPRPGEVTLAHRGVLFLDEFPEFRRDVINALRQPMEDRVVSVARARGTTVFPANFMLVAALNPCPCGKYGTAECACRPIVVEQYKRKFSGPIADRIDMWIQVGEIPIASLKKREGDIADETTPAKNRVVDARTQQEERFSSAKLRTNSDMGARDIEVHVKLSHEAEDALTQAAQTLKLSARGYHRTIKLARTIADLSGSEVIQPDHMLEALQYRPRENW